MDPQAVSQFNQSEWPSMRAEFARIFATKTQEEWQAVFDGTDACVTPVVELPELQKHRHVESRQLVVAGSDGFGIQLYFRHHYI